MKAILIAAAAGLVFAAPAFAKLPAPQLTDEQKAKAEEAKQRTAWQGKVGAYQLCQSQVATAEKYAKAMKAAGKDVKIDPGACTNPGPFVMAGAAPAPAAPAAPATPAAAAAAKK